MSIARPGWSPNADAFAVKRPGPNTSPTSPAKPPKDNSISASFYFPLSADTANK
jgi:hypothetical protein